MEFSYNWVDFVAVTPVPAAFILGIFLGRGFPQTFHSPPKRLSNCAVNLFFGRDNALQIYHGNFLLIGNKYRKSFVIKQPKRCKFLPKKSKYVWWPGFARTRWGSLSVLPDPLAAMGAYSPTSKGRKGSEGREPTSRGRKGGEERGDGKGGERIPPPPKPR